jgi:glycosyltransferase involved in cell wall biosynthesis
MTIASKTEPPLVSIVVPARNEEACLGACLSSLVQQTGVSFEVIVVDDCSSDRTRAIAESFAGVIVLTAGDPPAGYCGKACACQTGARAARGRWLLFTDADTVHRPDSLARAVAEAERDGAALLSYSPEQEVRGLAERALMPVIFAELACTYRPQEVSNPASPAAAANGQYLLVTREAYDAIGGHAAVAGNLLEDVALARAVKKSGRKLLFRFGAGLVRTRMYRSWSQMREGWTKNLALLFPSPGRLALRRMLEFAASVGALTAAAIALAAGSRWAAIVAAAVAVPT